MVNLEESGIHAISVYRGYLKQVFLQPDFEKNTDLVLHLTDEKQAGERPPGSSPAPDLMPAHLHEVSVREDQARERGYWHSSLEGQAEVGSWRILSSPRDLHHVSRWRNP